MTENNTQLMGQVDIIALATDGSEYCDGAVQEAIFLGQACGARIVVLSVIGIDSEIATSAHATSMTKRQQTSEYLENIKKMVNDNDIECEVVIEESYQPDKTIVELAYSHNADVLIMGRHGKKGLLKLLVGSMTSKVIGHGFPQVLVVPRNFAIGGDRILLATDGSEFSENAVDEAISMGIHCSTLKEIYTVSVASSEDKLDHARELTEKVCAKVKEQATNISCHPMALTGRAAEVIVATAKEKEVDIILVGGHGKGLSKLLMGHVTEKVIGKAHCAVLVIEGLHE